MGQNKLPKWATLECQNQSPDLIQKAGQAFVKVANQNPSAWDTALSFLQYKTFAKSFDINIRKTSGNTPFLTYFNYTTPPGTQPPSFKAHGIAPISQAAHLDYIGHDPKSQLPKGTAYVIGNGGNIVLDEMDLKMSSSMVYTSFMVVERFC